MKHSFCYNISMSDNDNTDSSSDLPTQSAPDDTSNWDDRPFTTPGERVVIEQFEGDFNDNVVAE